MLTTWLWFLYVIYICQTCICCSLLSSSQDRWLEGPTLWQITPLSQNTTVRSQNCNPSYRNTAGDVEHITLSFHSWDWGLSVCQCASNKALVEPSNHLKIGGGSGNICNFPKMTTQQAGFEHPSLKPSSFTLHTATSVTFCGYNHKEQQHECLRGETVRKWAPLSSSLLYDSFQRVFTSPLSVAILNGTVLTS